MTRSATCLWLACTLGSITPLGAAAQVELEESVPEPPSSEAISDAELIRWAANEVRIHERRPLAMRGVPMPPAHYFGTGIDGPLAEPQGREPDGVRLLAEIGGGTLGALVGGGLAALLVWVAAETEASPEWSMAAVAAGSTLAAFGVTGGVVLSGDALGGRGQFGHAFIGQLVGGVMALPLVTLGLAEDELPLALVSAGVFPLAGAILGYELSHSF